MVEALFEALLDIRKAPTLDYAPVRHGEWIHDINNLYACSECLMRQTQKMRGRLMNFCPNCGASMMDGGKAMAEWISVKDKLPPYIGKKILVVNGHGCIDILAFWKKVGNNWTWLDCDGHFKHTNDITHWMPLPEPPKEE